MTTTTKITDLPVLTTPTANGSNTVFVVVDKSSGTPTTKQITLQSLDSFVDNIGPIALAHANAAFDKANSANVLAQQAYNQANTDATNISITAGAHGNATYVPVITVTANGRVSAITNTAITGFANSTFATSAYDKANSANVLAQAAFDKANTDTTNISATAAVYGDSITIPVITLNANGRVSSITNTTIQSATSSIPGVVLLESSAISTSTANAATPLAVKTAYDLANIANTTAAAAYAASNAAFNTAAYTHANGAFDKANTSGTTAQNAYNTANTAEDLAQNAYDFANTDYTTISTTAGVYGNSTYIPVVTLAANGRVSSIVNTAITGFANATYTQAAFDKANTSGTTAQAAFDTANSGFNKANSANVIAQSAYDYANTISITLNNAFITASRNTANAAYAHANGAFDNSNTAISTASLSWLTANSSETKATAGFVKANAAFDKANSANTLAQNAYNYANTVFLHANSAYNTANTTASDVASIYGTSLVAANTANSSYAHANAAFDKANSGYTLADSANTRLTSAYDLANTTASTLVVAFNHANGAYGVANTALATAALAISYDNQANAAFDKANTANVTAQAAFDAANTKVSKSGDTMTGDLKFGGGGGILNLPTNQIAITANVDNDASGFIAQATGVSTVYANTDVQIQANTGGATFSIWNFNTNGSLTFPDSTIQTTAFTGNSLIIVASAPANNKGAGGDTKGMVYLANNYFYYCTANYTSGTANIWSRISATDAW